MSEYSTRSIEQRGINFFVTFTINVCVCHYDKILRCRDLTLYVHNKDEFAAHSENANMVIFKVCAFAKWKFHVRCIFAHFLLLVFCSWCRMSGRPHPMWFTHLMQRIVIQCIITLYLIIFLKQRNRLFNFSLFDR